MKPFSIRDFIMDALMGMKGHYPDFQIKEFALNWYGRAKISEEDLAELENYLNPDMHVEFEEVTEESGEETTE